MKNINLIFQNIKILNKALISNSWSFFTEYVVNTYKFSEPQKNSQIDGRQNKYLEWN